MIRKMKQFRWTYLPVAGHDWLLPLYDPVLRWLEGDRRDEAGVPDALLLDLEP